MTRYTKTGTPSTIGGVDVELDSIQVANTDTLSRKGDSPNQMEAVLDMNNNRIINSATPINPTDLVRLVDLPLPDSTPSSLSESLQVFPTLATLRLSELPTGSVVQTRGNSAAGDEGSAQYRIYTAAEYAVLYVGQTPDELGGAVTLFNGNIAVIQPEVGGVSYIQFGADPSGVADSWESINACHTFANNQKFPVRQNSGVFYVAARALDPFSIYVKTNWDLGGAKIVLRSGSGYPSADLKYIFEIVSYNDPVELTAGEIASWNTTYVSSLKKDSTAVPSSIFGSYKNAGVKITGGDDIIRSSGTPLNKGELIVLADNGGLQSPLTKDYTDGIVAATIYPADANRLVFNSPCWELDGVVDVRALVIRGRHNVTVRDGVVVETATQPPTVVSRTFFAAVSAYDIEWNNIRGEAWSQTTPPEGLYLFGGNFGANWRYTNCIGTHGWGASGLNYLKGVTFKDCSLNRYDIHWAGFDLLFENCDMHNWGVLCSGGNQMVVRDCRYYLAGSAGVAGDSPQYSAVQTRIDYGSEWDGDILVDGLEIIIGSDFTDSWTKNLSVVKFPVTSGATNYGRPTILGRTVSVRNVKIYMDDPARFATINKNWVMVDYEFDSNTANDYFIAHTINVSDCTIIKPLSDMAILAYNPPEHYKDTIKAFYNAPDVLDGDFNQVVSISGIHNCKGLRTSLPNTKLELVKFGGDLTNADVGWSTRADALRPLIKIDNCTGVSVGIAVNGNVEITNSEILILDDVANTRPTDLYVRINNCKLRFLDNNGADYLLPMKVNIDNSLFYTARTAVAGVHTLDFAKWSGAAGYEVVKGRGNVRVAGFLSSNDPVGFF